MKVIFKNEYLKIRMEKRKRFAHSWMKLFFTIFHSMELVAWDPKNDDLYLTRLKSEEIPMEDRSGADVQIVRSSWVKRRKTHRII